jgi:hypothetical protein
MKETEITPVLPPYSKQTIITIVLLWIWTFAATTHDNYWHTMYVQCFPLLTALHSHTCCTLDLWYSQPALSLATCAGKLQLKVKQYLRLEDRFKCDTNLSTSLLRSNFRHNQIPTGKMSDGNTKPKNCPTTQKNFNVQSPMQSLIYTSVKVPVLLCFFIIIYLHVTIHHPDHQRLVQILTHKMSKLCTSQQYFLHYPKQYFYKKNCIISLDTVLQLQHFTYPIM